MKFLVKLCESCLSGEVSPCKTFSPGLLRNTAGDTFSKAQIMLSPFSASSQKLGGRSGKNAKLGIVLFGTGNESKHRWNNPLEAKFG